MDIDTEFIPRKFLQVGRLPRWKNFFPPIDSAPFTEYLNTVALFVTKEDTIKRFPARAFENAFSNSPPTFRSPQPSRAHVFKGK